jgi:AcrR family transcriptional regulator
MDLEIGRVNQKRRTRAALVAAAVDLMRQGRQPSVAEVADAAQVGRTTAYRYFPTQEVLLTDAALDALARADVAHVLEVAGLAATAEARVDAVVRAEQAMTLAHEPEFRTMLRGSLEPRPDAAAEVPRRPANRLRWFARALAPARERLGPERFEQLVAALSLCVGIEALVVLRDVCGLDSARAEEVKRWAAATLVRASLDAAAATEPAREPGKPHRADRPTA